MQLKKRTNNRKLIRCTKKGERHGRLIHFTPPPAETPHTRGKPATAAAAALGMVSLEDAAATTCRFAYPIRHNPRTSGAKYGQTRINTGFAASHYMNYVQSARTQPHLPAKNSRASCPSGSGGAGVRHVARFFPIIHNTPLQNFRI